MAIDGFPVSESRQGRLTPNVGLNRFRFLVNRLHTTKGMNVGCVMCKFSIGTLVDAIKDDPSILDGIANDLKEICKIMPQETIRPGCVDFLNVYAKSVIILTLDEINSQQICQDFHLCSSHELREIRENANNLQWKNEVVCEACKTMADFLKFECQQRSFQESVTNEVKQVCDVMPGSIATSCDNLMDQYVPYVIQLLVNELDPYTICPELHLCPDANQRAADLLSKE
jgi:hypothetical protein